MDMVEWLAMESKAEIARMAARRDRLDDSQAEKSGETILDLVIDDTRPGIGGHQLVQFKRRNPERPMPSHRLKVGTPVVVSPFRSSDNFSYFFMRSSNWV